MVTELGEAWIKRLPSSRSARMEGILVLSFSWLNDSIRFEIPTLYQIQIHKIYAFKAIPVVRVSSARIMDTCFRTTRARFEKSSIQPIGVLTRCLVVIRINETSTAFLVSYNSQYLQQNFELCGLLE